MLDALLRGLGGFVDQALDGLIWRKREDRSRGFENLMARAGVAPPDAHRPEPVDRASDAAPVGDQAPPMPPPDRSGRHEDTTRES